jgi:signal transduction histidine kinase
VRFGGASPITFDQLRARLRVAAWIALVHSLLFIPVEAIIRPPGLRRTVIAIWIVDVCLSALALRASFAQLTVRGLDWLLQGLLACYVANALAYLAAVPDAHSLVAYGVALLLFVNAVFFSWTWVRMLVASVLAWVAFTAVCAFAVGSPEITALDAAALLVGATVATASANVLERFRDALSRRQAELATLSAGLMSVQEEERRRVSRELHEEVGQSLSAVNAYLWLLERQPEDGGATRVVVREARHLLNQTVAAIRELSGVLRPTVLDDFGLVPSLDAHLKAFEHRHEIETTLVCDGIPDRLPPDVETALYRIAQEALSNVAQHARAQRVSVRLAASEDALHLDIEDDGIGLTPRRATTGTGLIGIEERVRALGGTVAFESGRGTHVSVRLPLGRAA